MKPIKIYTLAVASLVLYLYILSAQPTHAQNNDPSINLVNQTQRTSATETWFADLEVSENQEKEYSVEATIFSKVLELNGTNLSNPIHRISSSIQSKTANNPSITNFAFKFEIRLPDDPRTSNSILFPDVGVYPITFDLLEDESIISTEKTYIIIGPANPTLNHLILSINDTNFENLSKMISQSSSAFSVSISAETLQKLTEDSATSKTLTESLKTRTIIPSVNIAPFEDQSLVEISTELYTDHLQSLRLKSIDLGLKIDESTILQTTPINRQLLDTAQSLGITQIYTTSLNNSVYSQPDLPVIIASNFETTKNFSTNPNPLKASVETLAAHELSNSSQPVTQITLDTDQSINNLQYLLEENGDFFTAPIETKEIRTKKTYTLSESNQFIPGNYPHVSNTLKKLNSYQFLYSEGGITPEYYSYQFGEALASNNPEQALKPLIETIDSEFESIALTPNQSINLTASNAQIPIAITNNSTGNRKVMIKLSSDKIDVDKATRQLIIEPGNTLENIEIDVRSLGVSYLDVVLLNSDGSLILDKDQIRIRSSVIPNFGIILTGGALGFLLLWWLLSIKSKLKLKNSREIDVSKHKIGNESKKSDNASIL